MEPGAKRAANLGTIALWLLLIGVAVLICLALLLASFSSVSGTATLPNGATARIHGAFSCSESSSQTQIEAGGRTFSFSPTTISIDGVPVAPLDASVTDVQIDVGFWSASLRVNGREVAKVR